MKKIAIIVIAILIALNAWAERYDPDPFGDGKRTKRVDPFSKAISVKRANEARAHLSRSSVEGKKSQNKPQATQAPQEPKKVKEHVCPTCKQIVKNKSK